jgi:O-antigen ligase
VLASARDLKGVQNIGRWLLVFGVIFVVESIQHKTSPTLTGWAGQSLGWIDPEVLAAGGTGRTRWVHIFDGPGVFCVIFTTALPFALRYLDPGQPPLRKVLGGLAAVALMFAIFLNGSRGGFLATLFILAMYTLLRFRISPGKLAAGVSLSAVLFLMAPSHLTTFRDDSRSADHRVDMWAEGIEMASHNPLLGIGRGNFRGYTSELVAHNSAIEIMGEMGFVGLMLWVALIYVCAKGVWLAYRTAPNQATRSLMAAVLIALGGYVVSAMFVTLEYETFYLLLALTAAAGLAAGQKLMLTRKDAQYILGIVVVWFVVLKGFVMAYY